MNSDSLPAYQHTTSPPENDRRRMDGLLKLSEAAESVSLPSEVTDSQANKDCGFAVAGEKKVSQDGRSGRPTNNTTTPAITNLRKPQVYALPPPPTNVTRTFTKTLPSHSHSEAEDDGASHPPSTTTTTMLPATATTNPFLFDGYLQYLSRNRMSTLMDDLAMRTSTAPAAAASTSVKNGAQPLIDRGGYNHDATMWNMVATPSYALVMARVDKALAEAEKELFTARLNMNSLIRARHMMSRVSSLPASPIADDFFTSSVGNDNDVVDQLSRGGAVSNFQEDEPSEPQPSNFQGYQESKRQPIESFTKSLSLPSDKDFLNPVHQYLRSTCIELFMATEDHFNSPGRGGERSSCMKCCNFKSFVSPTRHIIVRTISSPHEGRTNWIALLLLQTNTTKRRCKSSHLFSSETTQYIRECSKLPPGAH